MGELYDRIASLCSNKGIKPGKMCNDLGISRGSIGDLKKGRREGISIKTATKIADYFGVTTDYLLTGEEIKKHPPRRVNAKSATTILNSLCSGAMVKSPMPCTMR